jgi:hypothetical protein
MGHVTWRLCLDWEEMATMHKMLLCTFLAGHLYWADQKFWQKYQPNQYSQAVAIEATKTTAASPAKGALGGLVTWLQAMSGIDLDKKFNNQWHRQ